MCRLVITGIPDKFVHAQARFDSLSCLIIGRVSRQLAESALALQAPSDPVATPVMLEEGGRAPDDLH